MGRRLVELGEAFNTHGSTSLLFDVNDHAMQLHRTAGDRKQHRTPGQELLNDGTDLAPETTLHGTTHAGVAKESGAVRENLLVRGLRVRVRADDGADFAIEKAPHGDLLARRFGVNI